MEQQRCRFLENQTGKILRNPDILFVQEIKDFADKGSPCIDQRIFFQKVSVLQPGVQLDRSAVGIPRDFSVFAQSSIDCRTSRICQ